MHPLNWCNQEWYAALRVRIVNLNCGFVAQRSFCHLKVFFSPLNSYLFRASMFSIPIYLNFPLLFGGWQGV